MTVTRLAYAHPGASRGLMAEAFIKGDIQPSPILSRSHVIDFFSCRNFLNEALVYRTADAGGGLGGYGSSIADLDRRHDNIFVPISSRRRNVAGQGEAGQG